MTPSHRFAAPGATPGQTRTLSGLSVVIPAYNEEGSVAATIERVSAAVQSLGIDYEIIAVNDGSGDRTGQVVRDLVPRVPHLRLVEHIPNRGYGGSLRAGFDAARHDWIAFLPGDNQFDPTELRRLIERAGDADIVILQKKDLPPETFLPAYAQDLFNQVLPHTVVGMGLA